MSLPERRVRILLHLEKSHGERRAYPKSQIFRSQLAFRSRLDGLRSRWRTLRRVSLRISTCVDVSQECCEWLTQRNAGLSGHGEFGCEHGLRVSKVGQVPAVGLPVVSVLEEVLAAEE